MSANSSPQVGVPHSSQRGAPVGPNAAGDRARRAPIPPPSYISDPKYKKYTQQVEKCLSSFDSVHEWADFISFLKQLLKTFQSYMQFKEIPRKLIVSKRLSQCLNPALPTGVHQRALDVYAHILAVLGSEGLQRDLALWSSGLFPFFEYAATSVKPTLLNLFDTHYLPLQTGLRPVMKSFVLALLPGLEEETGEFFDKVLSLLDKLSGTVSPSFFLQNMWLIMLTSPSARGTAINFLSRRLPRLNADEDIAAIVGRDIGLMIRAFSAALEDDDLLVRRGALDILLQSLHIDSVAVKKAQMEDRVILMRAATSVVLRRDLSLNRRLYSWLLGPDENSEHQVEFLKKHALELLRSTLSEEMFRPSADYARSRPFKIFISLLDKWEIGAPLSEVLVLDAFKAIKESIDAGADSGEDMSMTAGNLYEAVEPHALWRQLLGSVLSDVAGKKDRCEGIRMVQYLLTNFHTRDEEIEAIHLPICFFAILEVLVQCTLDKPEIISYTSTRESLLLLLEIIKRIPPNAMRQRPELKNMDVPAEEGSYSFACFVYGLEKKECQARTRTHLPIAAAFHDLVALTMSLGKALPKAKANIGAYREAFVHSLRLLSALVVQIHHMQGAPPTLCWEPRQWVAAALDSIQDKTAAFSVVDTVISTVASVQSSTALEPSFSFDDRESMSAMISPLLRYLHPPWAAYHSRAVSLIWSLESSATSRQVESIVSQYLSSSDPQQVREACEAFGVLWRLTDDALIPGSRLKIPMMIVLDTLKSDDPNLRRVGETWMRCSLKSYLRVLDPLIHDLYDPSIRRSPSAVQLRGRQIEGFEYDYPFDQRYINHLLDTLLSVVRFGGQGFSKVARTTPVSRSAHPGLIERLQNGSGSLPDATYMDVVINILLRFLQSEPKSKLIATMQPFNMTSQSLSIDLLQALVSRGEIDVIALQSLESVIIGKLYISVHTHRLDLQNKLLHLLHSIISAFNTHVTVPSSTGLQREHSSDGSKQEETARAVETVSYTVHPLLIQTLIDGISTTANRSVMQHWLDFILMTVPQFPDMLHNAIVPLNDNVCRQLRLALADVLQASNKSSIAGDITAFTTDADIIMLLNAVERLVLLSLSHVADTGQLDDDGNPGEKAAQETTGLLGYVSNVFSSDTPGALEDQPVAKSSDYRCLFEAIPVLHMLWESFATPAISPWASQEESLSLIYSRSRTRCRRVLEHLFRPHPAEVLECIVECWSQSISSLNQSDSAVFELVDVLTPNAQAVVHMLCDSISSRIPGMTEKHRKHALSPRLSDMTLFDFLEQYCRRLEGPLAVQVWAPFMQMAKDLAATFKDFKPQAFPALRCFSVLADKVVQSAAVEDRRVRKELQDTYAKLLETCLLAGRSVEGSRIRRGPSALGLNGRDSPLPRDTRLDEKLNASSTSLPETARGTWSIDPVDQINQYIASDVLPNLRKFLVESDKIQTACNSIVYNVIAPAMKGRSKPLDVDDSVLCILREMTRLAVAVKAWRGLITDVLNDNRCFNSTPEAGRKWRPMVKMLFDTDKAAITELLGKITTAPSTNIFTNREYEMLLRSLNLRRLSYVLLAGDKNHFLTHLPTIQEKLVDTLRNVTAPIVQSEVYICVRVLLCRLSPHNLSSFWPVILAELYRLFEQVLTTIPSDGSEELGLILSACKLLDLLLVLQTQEFQVHQWIFITDTVDAIYRPDNWSPEAILDRLAEVVGNLPMEEGGKHTVHGASTALSDGGRAMRRPMLQSVRQIDSIRDLAPFFSHASMASYESVYNSGGLVDWEAVETGLLEDMFDGRLS